ncbi:putative PurR-regulated permease PerM [Evansella vedderi]|uniref:PurR-regulated permease PerM n=1 Tax=Evansella vedderi TaxID=38282 RepID=A0ABT9ZSR6_9BACI|nr:AI-2E family transporter [Evansella vedderi]MDQ0254279.1 putative PurR-regulated permease PerM [Evansella vedderi]
MENRLLYWIMRLGFVLLVGLVLFMFVQLLTYISPLFKLAGRIALPFILAGIIAYLLHPIVERLEKNNVPRPLSILLIYSAFIVMFVWIIFKGTPYIIQEGQDLLEQLPKMAETYRNFANTVHEQTEVLPSTFQERADGWLESVEAFIAESILQVGVFLRELVDWMLLLIVIPFIVFYLLKDINLVKKVCWYLTPERFRSEGLNLIKEVDHSLGNYIRGQLLVCAVVGLLAYIGFLIINMPYALLLAVFIGLTNIIPYFGPIIGVIPVIFIALTESLHLVILGLIVNFIVQIIEGNLLAPIIVGKTLHMHPVLIIFALIVGGEMAGVIGLIISVPILTILRVIFLHVRRLVRERKGIYT